MSNGSGCGSASYNAIGAYFAQIITSFPPAGCSPVASASFSSPDRVLGMLNQQTLGTTQHASTYTTITAPGKTISLPLWIRQSGSWNGGLAVRNINNQSTTVTARFYNAGGSVNSASNQTLQPHQLGIFFNTPASPFSGSAIVIADRPVAAVVNHSQSSSSSDALMTYEAVHY